MSQDIIALIAGRIDEMRAGGHAPVRVLIGHREAAEVEAALYRRAKTWRGLFGEVIAEDPEYAPKLPYPLIERVTVFGVPVERVDQASMLGVIGDDSA